MSIKKYIGWDVIAIILGLIMVLILGSCSCNYHISRAEKKCGKIQNDTLIFHDSILVDKIVADTVFKSREGDTVYLTKDRLKIKYVDLPGDSVYIYGKCDTIYLNRFIKVPYEKTVIKYDWWLFIRKNILWLLLLAIVIYLLTKK